MKSFLAIVGILFVLGGMLSGLLDWFLVEFYLESVEWEGPMVTVNTVAWFLHIVGVGLGVVLIGAASMMRFPQHPQDTFQ